MAGEYLPRHFHPHQFPLKCCAFPGAETARKQFLLRGASSHAKKLPRFRRTRRRKRIDARGLWPSRALPGQERRRTSKASRTSAPQLQNAKQHTHLIPLQQGRALHQNALPCRLQPPSGAAAVQRGEKRIQGGSRGNSQSPYPSLAAGGCHAAAAAAKSGARKTPQILGTNKPGAQSPPTYLARNYLVT